MAATASSNLARLRYVKETTFGTTPVTGASTDFRFTGESLDFNIKTDTSKEIRADRNVSDLVQLGAETAGGINFELSYGTFDDMLAAALGSDWATDVLKNGTSVPFFSIEKGFTDVSQYWLFRGMAVNTMSLDFSIGAILTGSFGFMGKDALRANATGVPAAGTPGTPTEVLNSASNFANLSVAGTLYPCGISKVTLATDAGLRAQDSVGNMGACKILPGTFKATGSVTVYLADGTMYAKYIAGSPIALSWDVSDAAGNKYAFSIPRAKISSAKVVAGALDQDVVLDIEYQATYDPTAACSLSITRTAAI